MPDPGAVTDELAARASETLTGNTIKLDQDTLSIDSRKVRRRGSFAEMGKLNLYYGTVKATAGKRHIMAWAKSREDALDLVEAALTTNEPVLGSVVGPLTSLPDDVMKPGVFVETTPAPKV